MVNDAKDLVIARMQSQDLGAALAIQSEVYPSFLIENTRAFASRLAIANSYCLTAKCGGAMVAYLIAYGWPKQSPPPLHSALSSGKNAEVLYIHDLAVARTARDSRVGRTLAMHALNLAAKDGLLRAELIAVSGAEYFWRKLGFIVPTMPVDFVAKLAEYGTDAQWMTLGSSAQLHTFANKQT